MVAITSNTGTPLNTYTYDPYGQSTSSTAPIGFGFDSGFLLPGGLYHFNNRDYDPNSARWTQIDLASQSLVTDPTQADPYSFADEDPVNSVDPSGEATLPKWVVTCLVSLRIASCVVGDYAQEVEPVVTGELKVFVELADHAGEAIGDAIENIIRFFGDEGD